MKITSVECSATFNLGNYQSVKFGYTADVHDNDEEGMENNSDEATDVMAELKRLINIEAQAAGVKPAHLLPI